MSAFQRRNTTLTIHEANIHRNAKALVKHMTTRKASPCLLLILYKYGMKSKSKWVQKCTSPPNPSGHLIQFSTWFHVIILVAFFRIIATGWIKLFPGILSSLSRSEIDYNLINFFTLFGVLNKHNYVRRRTSHDRTTIPFNTPSSSKGRYLS